MRIRKTLRSVSVVSLLVALGSVIVACGGSGGNEEQVSAAEPEPSMYCGPDCQEALQLETSPESIDCTVGLSWSSAAFPYGAAALEQAEEAQEQFFPNMQLYTGDGQGSSSTQAGQINDLVARGIDTLVVSPNDADALSTAVEQAQERDVEVITADRSVNTNILSAIGANNVQTGKEAANYIVERLEGEGNVVEISGSPGASPTIDRNNGFTEVIENNPGIEVIASQNGDYNRAEGLSAMEDILQRFSEGEIDAVFTHADEMSLGAIQAIKDAGREDEIFVVGIDGQESALESVEAGDYAATVVYPVPMPEAIIAAAKACAGGSLPETIEQETPVVTEDNVEQYKGTTF